MNSVKKFFSLIFLLLYLFVSGCTTSGKNLTRPDSLTPTLDLTPIKKTENPNVEEMKQNFKNQTGLNLDIEIAEDRIPKSYRTYRIGPGDEMEILVERLEEFDDNRDLEISSDFIENFAGIVFTRYKVKVDPLGNIHVPLVGELQATGRSREEVEADVRTAMNRFLVNPKVFVKVASYSSYTVSVLGKVTRPGQYEIKRPVSLSEAIALAGGVSNEGTMSKIYVARRMQKSRKFNITEVWSKKGIDQEILLGRDDVVFVPHKLWITWTTAEQIASVIDILTNVYFRYKNMSPV